MSWSAPFLAALEESGAKPWVWFIQPVDIGTEEVYNGTAQIGTHPDYCASVGTNADGSPKCLMSAPPSIEGPRLTLRSWEVSTGVTTIRIAGDITDALQRFTRGTVVEVRMGLAPDLATTFTRIAFGRVNRISGGPVDWTMEISDALTVLQTRPNQDYAVIALAGGISTMSLAAKYTVADTYIEVNDATNVDFESGGTGLIYVVPSDGTEPFFLTFTGTNTGVTPHRITGLSASGIMGTTASTVNLVDGATVYDCFFVEGHPIESAMKVWMSTGAGTNGTYDTLPSLWGYDISQGFFDIGDMENERDSIVIPSAGNYNAYLWSEAKIEAPGDFMRGFLQSFGCYITVRQGEITVRGASMDSGRKRSPVLSIDDFDIIPGSARLVATHDDSQDEEGRVYVYSGSGSSVGDYGVFATAPGVYSGEYDASLWMWSNELRCREELRDRVLTYHCRLPEVWEVKTAGLRCAQLTVGDWVQVASSIMVGRLNYGSSYGGLSARPAEIVQVSVDLAGNMVTLRFIAWPDDPENDIWP